MCVIIIRVVVGRECGEGSSPTPGIFAKFTDNYFKCITIFLDKNSSFLKNFHIFKKYVF